MTTFHSLEGVEGFRWGLFFKKNGATISSTQAPTQQAPAWQQLFHKLEMLPSDLCALDLLFDLGRVLVRCGEEGRVVLFCDRTLKMTAINLIVGDLLKHSETGRSSLGDTDSKMSLVQTISFGNKLIPQSVIDELMDLFTRVLGPLAPKLAQFLARKRGIDISAVYEKNWSDLLNSLAGQIDDEKKRDKFLDAAVVLKNKF